PERERVAVHVDGCQRGCKEVIGALLRGHTVPAAPEVTVRVPTRAVSPTPTAAVVARDDPQAETQALLRRRLLLIFATLAGVGGAGAFVELVAGLQYEWWHWIQPSVWAGVAVLLASRRLSLPALRACELFGFGSIAVGWVGITVVLSDADLVR